MSNLSINNNIKKKNSNTSTVALYYSILIEIK